VPLPVASGTSPTFPNQMSGTPPRVCAEALCPPSGPPTPLRQGFF
jgi:hypothetical protein